MKKILYICDQSPFGNSYGSQQRTNLLFNLLCEKGHVDLICFTSAIKPQSGFNPNCTIKYFYELPVKARTRMGFHFENLLNIFYSFSPYSVFRKNSEARKNTHALIQNNNYDYIVLRYLKNAFVCGLSKDKRIIMDVDDLPEQSILSYANSAKLSAPRYMLYWFYAKRAKFYTNRFLKGIGHSFFSNESQCKWQNSSYLPNIPFPFPETDTINLISTSEDTNHSLLFVGLMNYSPNSDGVDYFIKNIWGNIKGKIPDAVFRIAGDGVTIQQKATWEKIEGIKVLGFVPDIYKEYKECKAVVVPVYYGAGTNIKVLEAMSMKRASVISEYSAKAFNNDLVDYKNVLVAADDKDFANKTIQLLLDAKLNADIANNGVKTIQDKYSYSLFKESVNRYLT